MKRLFYSIYMWWMKRNIKEAVAEAPPCPTPEPTPIPPVITTPPPAGNVSSPSVADMANGIKKFEGWYPGSRSFRNNNPGNIRSPIKGAVSSYLGLLGAYAVDDKNFCIFHTPEDGFKALCQFLQDAITWKIIPYRENKVANLYDFFHVYAPGSDDNDPKAYAEFVAKEMKVVAIFPLKEIQL